MTEVKYVKMTSANIVLTNKVRARKVEGNKINVTQFYLQNPQSFLCPEEEKPTELRGGRRGDGGFPQEVIAEAVGGENDSRGKPNLRGY